MAGAGCPCPAPAGGRSSGPRRIVPLPREDGASDDAEHDAQPQPKEACPDPRVQGADEDPGRPPHDLPPPAEGPLEDLGERRAAGQEAAAVADAPRARETARAGPALPKGPPTRSPGVSGPGPGERFPREARLTSGRDVRRVLREGSRRRTGPVEVFAAPSRADRPRLGVVVPLYGHTAVERNRLQRRLREIGRRDWLAGAWEERREVDLLLRARPAAYGCGFDELREQVLGALDDL